MKVLSVRDIMLCEELAHIPNEITLIHPDNDALVATILEVAGFDVTKEFYYEASRHRDMQNKVAVGFQIIGEFSQKKEHKHLLTAFERTVVAGMSDPHLAKDMAEIMGKRFTYRNDDEVDVKYRVPDPRYYSEDELKALGYTGGNEDNSEDIFHDNNGGVDSSCDMITSQIAALTSIKNAIRGEQ